MKVLMFGWEFPPHILGGLGTASYGLTKGMSLQQDMEITFCIPKPWGDEDQSFLKIIGMNSTPVVWRDVNWEYVKDRVGSYMDPNFIMIYVIIFMPISIICIQMTWDASNSRGVIRTICMKRSITIPLWPAW